MSISVVPIPEASWHVSEGIGDQLDCCGGIGNKDDIEVIRISVEESEQFEPDTFDQECRSLRRLRHRMRVSVKVGHHVLMEALHQTLAIKGGSGMIEVDGIFVFLAQLNVIERASNLST